MKKLLFILLFPIIILAQSGSGTSGDPYIITTPAHFENMRVLGMNKYYELGADLDFTSFGDFVELPKASGAFTFSLDGNGYSISNMTVDSDLDDDRSGIFPEFSGTGSTVILKNITFDNIDISYITAGGFPAGNKYIAAIIGRLAVTTVNIENVTVSSCTTNFQAQTSPSFGISIFCGEINSAVNAGYIRNITLKDNRLTATITGNNAGASIRVGALVGYSNLQSSFLISKIAVYDNYVYASNDDNPSNGARAWVGGIIGYVATGVFSIEDSYSYKNYIEGDMTIVDDVGLSVGGIIGQTASIAASSLFLTRIYTADLILTSPGNSLGTIIGRADADTYVSESYIEINALVDPIGTGSVAVAGAYEIKTEAEMKLEVTYVDWDFDDVWNLSEYEQEGYPFLSGNILLVLLTPNTGDVYVTPETVSVSWVGTAGSNPEVDIYYSLNSGDDYTLLSSGETSPYEWTFSVNSKFARIKIDLDGLEIESGIFQLFGDRFINITSPLSFNSPILVGSLVAIGIETVQIDSISVEYSLDNNTWHTICDVIQTDVSGLSEVTCDWTIPDHLGSSVYLRAREIIDTVVYVFNQSITSVGNNLNLAIGRLTWHYVTQSSVLSYVKIDKCSGWCSGAWSSYTGLITDKATGFAFTKGSTCASNDCLFPSQFVIPDGVTWNGSKTLNTFYQSGSTVTYKGRLYYIASDSTIKCNDLINDIDSIFISSLKPFMNTTWGMWNLLPTNLTVYQVQRSKIQGESFPSDQDFESLNDEDFAPQLLIRGRSSAGGQMIAKLDLIPNEPSPQVFEQDVVQIDMQTGSGFVRDYFRGIDPKMVK